MCSMTVIVDESNVVRKQAATLDSVNRAVSHMHPTTLDSTPVLYLYSRSLRLNAVVSILGNLFVANQVMFHAIFNLGWKRPRWWRRWQIHVEVWLW